MQNIVDSSRRKYARERADVEQEIQALIASTTNTSAQQPKLPAPKSVTLGKIWPVDKGALPAKTEQGGEDKAEQPRAEHAAEGEPRKKRTRSRSRKRKPSHSDGQPTSQGSVAPRSVQPGKEQEIKLR
jgi:hypothetical protein